MDNPTFEREDPRDRRTGYEQLRRTDGNYPSNNSYQNEIELEEGGFSPQGVSRGHPNDVRDGRHTDVTGEGRQNARQNQNSGYENAAFTGDSAPITHADYGAAASTIDVAGRRSGVVKDTAGRSNVHLHGPEVDVQYGLEDVPPWYFCALLGFQHYLTMAGGQLTIPLILLPAMCAGGDQLAMSEVLGTMFFVSGMATLLQTTFGSRLPIVQGGSFTFLIPALAILNTKECPKIEESPINGTDTGTEHVWKSHMREQQGAIILASVVQVVIGLSGLVGLILRYLGPLVIATTVTLVGLSLTEEAVNLCQKQWWLALTTVVCITLFSQYLKDIEIPKCRLPCKRSHGAKSRTSSEGVKIFLLFPVILGIAVSWTICLVLTDAGVFPQNPARWSYAARTDIYNNVLAQAKWFRFPYPFQWGWPTVTAAGVFGMLAAVISGIVESVGDYYACAKMSGAPIPPVHAINRGTMMEGVSCVLSGMWGTGTGLASYSENIGAISITKVGSRRVVQTGACIMMALGIFGKFTALFVSIPEPVLGGVFLVTFGMIAAVGMSNLQYVDLTSTRNLFIFGLSLFFGLAYPHWLKNNALSLDVGVEELSQLFRVLLGTSMFVGGALAFLLDNTIPGTEEERGIKKWRTSTRAQDTSVPSGTSPKCYDLPFVMKYVRRWNWAKRLPVSPTYVPKEEYASILEDDTSDTSVTWSSVRNRFQ